MDMKRALLIFVVATVFMTVSRGAEREPRGAEPEPFQWGSTSPEAADFDAAALRLMWDELARRGTKALLVIRNDRIVFENYSGGYTRARKHYTASLAKAIVGGTSLAFAWSDGRLQPGELASRYVPSWQKNPRKSKITIRHLATHSSGIEDAESPGKSHQELSGWKGSFWRRQPDPFTMARDHAPALFEPGAEFAYSNPGIAMLGWVVTASLRGTRHADIRSLLEHRLMRPLNVPRGEWSMGYGTSYKIDGLSLCATWGGGAHSANAIARIGRLFLRGGRWQGEQILRSDIVSTLLRDAGAPTPPRGPGEGPFPRTTLGWYINSDAVWPDVPRDAFCGAGAGNQVLLVIPSLDLIVVRSGSQLDRSSFWGGLDKYLFRPLMRAMPDARRRIDTVQFAAVETIRRGAEGSDNWPITWLSDGDQFTSYGDGWGFTPRTEKKLSQGFAFIRGASDSWTGSNLRSPTGERGGDGVRGAKASGLIQVGGVLYAWVRNTRNATLIHSSDGGVTWTWGVRLEDGFGAPSFLQFGKNYQGARDDFVYSFSQNGSSAYDVYDGVALLRQPAGDLQRLKSIEYFAGFGERGAARWSRRASDRRAVFTQRGACYRLDVTFHPGLKRYLMALANNDRGAWSLLESPEPWGPWRTVFATKDWGLGKTHGYRLPAAWLDGDADSFAMIFSGRGKYDAFCVRSGRFVLRDPVHQK